MSQIPKCISWTPTLASWESFIFCCIVIWLAFWLFLLKISEIYWLCILVGDCWSLPCSILVLDTGFESLAMWSPRTLPSQCQLDRASLNHWTAFGIPPALWLLAERPEAGLVGVEAAVWAEEDDEEDDFGCGWLALAGWLARWLARWRLAGWLAWWLARWRLAGWLARWLTVAGSPVWSGCGCGWLKWRLMYLTCMLCWLMRLMRLLSWYV